MRFLEAFQCSKAIFQNFRHIKYSRVKFKLFERYEQQSKINDFNFTLQIALFKISH